MIVNAAAIVLSRRDWREADRLVHLYTEELGRVAVRFAGVNKPGRKLKALSEPMVWAEFRLYLSPRSEIGKVIGGQIISSFPKIRQDFDKTVAALSCLEMVAQLTPLRSPNRHKYALLCSALAALEESRDPWLESAFGLQLLELSGFGGDEAPAADRPLWGRLKDSPLAELSELPRDPERAFRFGETIAARCEAQAGRPLRTREFRESLRAMEGAPA